MPETFDAAVIGAGVAEDIVLLRGGQLAHRMPSFAEGQLLIGTYGVGSIS